MGKSKNKITTVLISGQAGEGVKEAGIIFGKLLSLSGQEVFVTTELPSLIKGGYIFSRISFSQEKVFSDYGNPCLKIDLEKELILFGQKSFHLPMKKLVEQAKAPPITKNSVALGALCYYFGLEFEKLKKIFEKTFKEKAQINIELAKKGYEYLKNLKLPTRGLLKSKAIGLPAGGLIDGNEALALGLVKAGLQTYFAYPMTPATSILHFLAKKQKEFGLKTVQPENEIAAVQMTLGSAFAGFRSACGTSGGGFDLMQETCSLAGMSEVPLLVIVSQRMGPSTGVPTHTSQSDLQLVRFSGHGEFLRIILAPGDPEEAYLLGAEALNLAWKYRSLVIVLLDKHLSESLATSFLDFSKISAKIGLASGRKIEEKKGLVFPGMKNVVVKAASYEHDEKGISTEDPLVIKKMQEKRFKKLQFLLKEQKSKETVKVYGDKKSKNIIICWGSVKGAVLESLKHLKKPAKVVQPLWLEPLDTGKIKSYLKGAKKIIDVEGNITAQLSSLIREKTGIEIKNKILKYDSRPFEPMELAKKINHFLI